MVNEPLSCGTGAGSGRRCGSWNSSGAGAASSPTAGSRRARSERSPVLIIPHEERRAVDPTNVGNYIFLWEPGTVGEDLYRQEGRAAIALGYTSLVNHSATPNCAFIRHFAALALDLVALRTIEAGEEITFDYGMTLWFEPG
jgi:hypothetical protein